MDEILDIRDDLHAPLVRFRSEVLRLSAEVADHALEPDFQGHIDQQWTSEVHPALIEIGEAMTRSGYATQLSKQVTPDRIKEMMFGSVGGGAFGVALGHVLPATFAVAAASMGLGAALDARKASQDIREEQHRSSFWFLYEANEHMSHKPH